MLPIVGPILAAPTGRRGYAATAGHIAAGDPGTEDRIPTRLSPPAFGPSRSAALRAKRRTGRREANERRPMRARRTHCRTRIGDVRRDRLERPRIDAALFPRKSYRSNGRWRRAEFARNSPDRRRTGRTSGERSAAHQIHGGRPDAAGRRSRASTLEDGKRAYALRSRRASGSISTGCPANASRTPTDGGRDATGDEAAGRRSGSDGLLQSHGLSGVPRPAAPSGCRRRSLKKGSP